jgi:predicted amidohydrolase YtcJ
MEQPVATSGPELVRRWAASGAMALTGRSDGPALVPPAGVLARIAELGERGGADAFGLLAERAAIAGLGRQGDRSCGSASRLLPMGDGWAAVTLARDEDVDLVPAWLELDPTGTGSSSKRPDSGRSREGFGGEGAGDDVWAAVRQGLAARSGAALVDRGRWLGLPVALAGSVAVRDRATGQRGAAGDGLDGLPVRATMLGAAGARRAADRPRRSAPLVVDLSSLWAGPLCARLLGAAGADVVKVESVHRPDGARRGPAPFFELLHGGHRAVALDLRSPEGVEALGRLLRAADVVVEASRPRALAQLGLGAEEVIARSAAGGHGGPAVWVSITGYGRTGPGRDSVAFGDDAAAAGGLVAWDGAGPCFLADAVADPLSGLMAAAAVRAALAAGGTWLLDVAMAEVAAHVAGGDGGDGAGGSTWAADPGLEPAVPHAQAVTRRSPGLGEHTDEVLAGLARPAGLAAAPAPRSSPERPDPGRSGEDLGLGPWPGPGRGLGREGAAGEAAASGGSSWLLRDVEVDGRRVDVAVDGGTVVDVAERIDPTGMEHVVDGGGGVLLPGLHDHHIHLLALAAARGSVPLGPPAVTTADEMRAALHGADAALPPGAWIRAVGYHERVAGPLDRHVLDAVLPVPGRPVRVQHRSGGLWVLNSAGLAAAGVPDTAAGETGRLFRMDGWLAERVGSDLDPGALAAVGDELASYGVTGVTDATPFEGASGRRGLEALAAAVRVGELPQRIVVTGGPGLDPDVVSSTLPRGPVKVLLHDHRLPALDKVVSWIAGAHRAGRPVAVHCVTREALVLTVAALEAAGSHGGDRIEHGAVVPGELVPTLRRLGLTVVTQPGFVAERGDDYLADVDAADRPDLWRCASLVAGGVGVAGSTDAPFGHPDPWRAMAAAVERCTAAGRVLGADERLAVRRALDLFLGPLDRPAAGPRRVEPGVPADLCLLAQPTDDLLADPAAAHVVATVLQGRLHVP